MRLFSKHPDADASHRGAIRRLIYRVYRRHTASMVLVAVLSSVVGLTTYAYAWAGKIVADDIVQVQLLALDDPAASQFDATLPGEQRSFTLAGEPVRQGLVDRIAQRPGKSTQEKLRLLAIVAGLMLLIEVLRHAADWVILERTVHVGQHVQFRLRQQLHEKLTALPMHYHDRHSPGKLLTHLFSDVQTVEVQLKFLVRRFFGQIISLFVGTSIVMYLDARLGVLVLVALPAYAIAYRTVRNRMIHVNRTWREREGRLNGMIANRVGGFSLVKAFVREQHEAVEFVRAAKPVMRDAVSAQMLSAGFGAMCGIITGVCMTAVLWLGALRVRDGQMTLGQLLLFYTAAGTMFSPVTMLSHLLAMLHRLRAIATRINDVLDEPIILDDPVDPVAIPVSSCELRFDHVTMRYPGNRPAALDDVTFTLSAGRRLCVMGPSGSGKTTLAKLAVRLYDPQQGTVLYDRADVSSFRMADLRRFCALVNQEPVVFSGSIADNISYGSDVATPQSVSIAARYAQIEPFIEQLPQQYRTLTQERGLTLSGGQKQRLNLARALHADPKLLILDDCTSALDAHTEAQIIDAFRSALDKRTAMLVTHRVSLAFECDYVLMLDAGKVVQFGSPQEMAREAGPFADLYNQQTDKAQHTLRSTSA